MDERTTVKFGADASGVKTGSQEAASAITSLKAFVQGLADAFLVAGGAATHSFREMKVGAAEAAEGVKGAAEAVTEFRELVAGVGEAVLAAFAVEQVAEFAKKMGEAAEATYHTALAFGLSTAQVQELKGQFTALGLAPEAGIQAMTRLDRAFATAKSGGERQAAVFQKLGIDIHGAYTQSELFEKAVQGLSEVPAGPARVAEAMQLFGRNIQNIAPLLGMTKEQLEEVNKSLDEYGVVSDEATAKGLGLAEAFNTNKLAGLGLQNVLTDALAPAFTTIVAGVNELAKAFIESYNQGGTAKVVMEAIAVIIKVIETAFVVAGGVIKVAWDIVVALVRTVVDILGEMYNFIKGPTLEAVSAIGQAWSAISGPVISVIQAIIRAVRDAASAVFAFLGAIPGIGFEFRAIGREASAALSRIVADAKNAASGVSAVWKGIKLPELPKASAGTTADDPSGKAKKGPKGPGIVQEWEEELHAAEALSGDFFGDQVAKELKFWQDKLAQTRVGTKEWIQVQEKIYQLSKQMAVRDRQDSLDEAKQSAQDRVKVADDELAVLREKYAAQREAIKAARQSGDTSPQQEMQALLQVQQEEEAAIRAHEEAVYQIKKREHDRELELYATDPLNKAKVSREIERMETQHQGELNKIVAKGVREREKIEVDAARDNEKLWKSRVGSIVKSWGDGIKGMIYGTQTWRQAVGGILDSMFDKFMQWIEKQVTAWITHEILKTTATTAGAATRTATEATAATATAAMSSGNAILDVANAAVRAAANTYAAISAIPVIGPFLAPAMAGAAIAAVFAIGKSIVSSRGGLERVGEDGQLAELHRDETVLPASYARPLSRLLADMDFGGRSPVGQMGAQVAAASAANDQGKGGDVHFHYGPTVNHQDATLERLLEREGETMRRWVRNQVRSNKLKVS